MTCAMPMVSSRLTAECYAGARSTPVLPRPERPEVHSRVTGLPALHEPLHGWVHDDLLELLEREEPCAADHRLLDLDVVQRAVRQVSAEDHVDDVPVARLPVRGDRLGDRDRAFELYRVPQAE